MAFMDYERPSVTADVVLFRIKNIPTGNRSEDKKVLQTMLVKRKNEPCANKFAIPGGFVSIDKTIEETAFEVVRKKVGISGFYMEQLKTFDALARDDRWRVISTAHIGICNDETVYSSKTDCMWFTVCKEGDSLYFISDNEKYIIGDNSLAFDHKEMILTALERMKNKVFYSDIAFKFLPETFRMSDLQKVFEIINDGKIDNFRRIISKRVEETGETYKGKASRPAKLYRQKI